MRISSWWAIGCSLVLLGPACSAARASEESALERELSQLAERLDRLEAENAALRQRNDDLERRVSQLEPKAVAAATLPVAPEAVAPAAAVPAANLEAPWYERFKVSGLVFGDAYAVLANHDRSVEDQTGFWIRRGYLTFDARIDEDWSARLRFEINSPGDFETNGKLDPFVKDAYLAWKHAGHEWYLGLSPSPTWDYVESQWGERHVEKSPLDLYRLGSSRDVGVAYRGRAADGRVFYHAMLGNGSGDGSETNKGKKVMGSLGLRPTDAWSLNLYADYEDRPGHTDRTTWEAFATWRGERARYGLQYAQQQRELEEGGDQEVAVASAFGVWKLTSNGQLIARYDRSFDGYPDADRISYLVIPNDTPFDLAILGWEQRLQKRISLTPNLEYVSYRESDGRPAPDDDLYGRLTLFFEF